MSENKIALITGCNGQDGSYLSEFLLNKGYTVVGLIRRNSVSENQTSRINGVISHGNFHRIYGDVLDPASIAAALNLYEPTEIYHLAAQSHVRISFDVPIYTSQVNAIGTLNLLEAARALCPGAKIYNAASSEMFGNQCDADGFQREDTKMVPVSPYACSKLFAYNMCKHYRQAHGMFITNGILFNHGSPRRGSNFVEAKIVLTLLRNKVVTLGNVNACRDWGHAKDYVEAMYLMMQHDWPDDFVIATGVTNTVKHIYDYVCKKLALDPSSHLGYGKEYERPQELYKLKGDSSKARDILGWAPNYNLEALLDDMLENMQGNTHEDRVW